MRVDVVAGLGVAALPLSSYAADSTPVTVNAKIDETLEISTEGSEVNLGILTTGIKTDSVDVTVKAVTATQAYSLYIKDSDEDTGLYLGGNAATAGENVIPAKAGLTAGTTGWGVRLEGETAYKEVTKYSDPSGTLLKSTGNAEYDEGPDSDEGETTKVVFGASYANDGKLETGDYSGKVVFIAVANS